MDNQIQSIDGVYEKYGFEIKSNHKGAKVYLYTRGIYPGAEIYKLSDDCDIEKIKNEYQNEGFAVKIKEIDDIKNIELNLFKEFFKADNVLISLKKRYNDFTSRIMKNLPNESVYEYIQSPFEMAVFSNNGILESLSNFKSTAEENLITKVNNLVETHVGPLFLIIEAAAGFGKTCSAYEILNEFTKMNFNKVPFFTELSRDRKAALFSHILRKEIEDQFANRVDSNIVLHEIKEGRVPLIIDGFDELISKDFSFNTSLFSQIESMLSTIVDLLSGNAKIIITSRKTAIFDSEEFHNWMADRNNDYTLIRITISEPKIEHWLSKDKCDYIKNENIPLDEFANPVLLTYLKYLNINDLKSLEFENKSIVDNYIDFLLRREQDRQNLPMDIETQLRVFRKLVRLFTEFDIKTASKQDIKDLILEFNKKILDRTLKLYTSIERPKDTFQLAEILSNHALLDRKDNKNIGFVNDFLLGTLIGQNLINGKFKEHNADFAKSLNQTFSLLAVNAFKVQPKLQKDALWSVFESEGFNYDKQFYFTLDVEFKKEFCHKYEQTILTDFDLRDTNFTKKDTFSEITFANCSFYNCTFSYLAFKNSAFVSCHFFDCNLTDLDLEYEKQYFSVLGCDSNNNFFDNMFEEKEIIAEIETDFTFVILEKLFKQGNLKPKTRQLIFLKEELAQYNQKEISKEFQNLKKKELIYVTGNVCHLSKEGIAFFNQKYR